MANEKRLVAYDPVAFGEFTQSLRNTLEVYDPYSDGYEDGMGRIEDWLEYNYVDAVEVVHGRWEWDTEDVYKCSNCAEKSHVKEVMGHPAWDYCPGCGAQMMDGDGNG